MNDVTLPQHFVVFKQPPQCFFGAQFARLFTLNRHIQESVSDGRFPCTQCSSHQGEDAFKRKRDLQKHLRQVHGYGPAELEALFPSRETDMITIPVCHFSDCDYFRAPDFKKKSPQEQKENRPFHRQSDYPKHMRDEHNWSPFNCKVTDCPRNGKKGFFSKAAYEKHYEEKHPGVAAPVQSHAEPANKCNYCGIVLAHSTSLYEHQNSGCRGEVRCPRCQESVQLGDLREHQHHRCRGIVSVTHSEATL
ncbi:hypothetical protein GGR51DRAFT_414965 [Nemania sp. FL0031]|nr:hypothetical protein GGR51DRAFT_414965 [Nemania sp. FL0031]